MFRKPKKKPSALRGASSGPKNGSGGGSGEGDRNAHHDVVSSGGGSAAGAGKKRRRPRQRSSSSSSEEDNNSEGEGTSGILEQLRQERENKSKSGSSSSAPLLNTSSTSTKKKSKNGNNDNWMHQYKTNNDPQMSAQENATRTAEYHPSNRQSTAAEGVNNSADNTSAATSQNAQIAALKSQPRNKFLAGPLRATTFVRTTVRFDYQPDICKDYKETGFCGFGDTCIYLHDRGDTKTGWQMEQEYEEKKKRDEEKRGKEMERFMTSMNDGKGDDGDTNIMESSSGFNDGDRAAIATTDDGIPFACHLCRGAFKDPIVTTCNHYFCEKCMLARIKETGGNTGCPICQKDTHGVLNHPQKLVAKKRRLVGRDATWEEYLERSKGGADGADGDGA